MFGEMEFWFAMIKIVAIVALIVVGLVMVMHSNHRPAWKPLSPICGMTAAGSRKASADSLPASRSRFRLRGIELVGTAAAETKDPGEIAAGD
jgi:D-serine/D-alanine/glycine transporter